MAQNSPTRLLAPNSQGDEVEEPDPALEAPRATITGQRVVWTLFEPLFETCEGLSYYQTLSDIFHDEVIWLIFYAASKKNMFWPLYLSQSISRGYRTLGTRLGPASTRKGSQSIQHMVLMNQIESVLVKQSVSCCQVHEAHERCHWGKVFASARIMRFCLCLK